MTRTSALFADQYELTMAQAYVAEGMSGAAAFELSFRKLPRGRPYVVAAGLASVLEQLESFAFDAADIAYLRELGNFSEGFLHELEGLRFSGDVWAVPEGTLVFPNEPLLRVVAPIVEAQLVETFVLNQIHFHSVAASKAALIVEAAQGKSVVDFGSRRAHGVDAALGVARASYLAGASGTSNLLAGKLYGVPTFGTMAHSFVQAFDRESDAFEAFLRIYPNTTLLVDTYDTLAGVERVIELSRRSEHAAHIRAVRLDSGNLLELSRATRARLDAAGLNAVGIFASSELDEHAIASLLAQHAPIDGFGVGTELAVSPDAPAFDMAYKLVEYDGVGRSKLSPGKLVYPCAKQVFRCFEGGVFAGDVVGRADEQLEGEPLLRRVMQGGRRSELDDGGLEAARARCKDQLARFPQRLRAEPSLGYPVQVSAELARELDRSRRRTEVTNVHRGAGP